MNNALIRLPKEYQDDLNTAIGILKEIGCKDIYLFGSLTEGNVNGESDIDLAVTGCPQNLFFTVYGRLLRKLKHNVDLIDLDSNDAFARFLVKQGELINVK